MNNIQPALTQKPSLYFKLYFWWLLLTTIHTIITLFSHNIGVNFLGLFVPLGDPIRLFLSTPEPSILIGFIITVILVIGASSLLEKFNGKKWIKIIFILLGLFTITIITDVLVHGYLSAIGAFVGSLPIDINRNVI